MKDLDSIERLLCCNGHIGRMEVMETETCEMLRSENVRTFNPVVSLSLMVFGAAGRDSNPQSVKQVLFFLA